MIADRTFVGRPLLRAWQDKDDRAGFKHPHLTFISKLPPESQIQFMSQSGYVYAITVPNTRIHRIIP